MSAPPDHFDFRILSDSLDDLLTAMENQLDREVRRLPGGDSVLYFLPTFRVAKFMYRTIRYICADTPEDPARLPEYALSIPPLNRSILDIVMNTAFILEDLQPRLNWFVKSGWASQRMEFDRTMADFGDRPLWREWLEQVFSAPLEIGRRHLSLTAEELANPRLVPRWPNPGKMPRFGLAADAEPSPLRRLLAKLNDFFYIDLSQQDHMSFSGVIKRARFFAEPQIPDREQQLASYRGEQVFLAVTLVLLLASLFDEYFRMGLTDRIRYLWTLIRPYSDPADLLYDIRFAAPLFPR
jgi:hypothetical protein